MSWSARGRVWDPFPYVEGCEFKCHARLSNRFTVGPLSEALNPS